MSIRRGVVGPSVCTFGLICIEFECASTHNTLLPSLESAERVWHRRPRGRAPWSASNTFRQSQNFETVLNRVILPLCWCGRHSGCHVFPRSRRRVACRTCSICIGCAHAMAVRVLSRQKRDDNDFVQTQWAGACRDGVQCAVLCSVVQCGAVWCRLHRCVLNDVTSSDMSVCPQFSSQSLVTARLCRIRSSCAQPYS